MHALELLYSSISRHNIPDSHYFQLISVFTGHTFYLLACISIKKFNFFFVRVHKNRNKNTTKKKLDIDNR